MKNENISNSLLMIFFFTIEQFFLTVRQNNYGNKIPFMDFTFIFYFIRNVRKCIICQIPILEMCIMNLSTLFIANILNQTNTQIMNIQYPKLSRFSTNKTHCLDLDLNKLKYKREKKILCVVLEGCTNSQSSQSADF